MIKIKIPYASGIQDQLAAKAIFDALKVVSVMDKAYRYLTDVLIKEQTVNGYEYRFRTKSEYTSNIEIKPSALYDPEVQEVLGNLPEDFMRDQMQKLLSSISFDTLTIAARDFWFTREGQQHMVALGSTNIPMKLYQGITLLNRFYQWVYLQDETNVHTADEWYNISEQLLRVGLGDILYALMSILQIKDITEALTANEQISYDTCINYLQSKFSINIENMCMPLTTLSNKYFSVVPLFEKDPQAWYDLCQYIDPILRESFIDLGMYMYAIDIQAIRNQQMSFDDNYLSILEDRAERDETGIISTLVPDEWTKFQKSIPDELAFWFVTAEPYLTPGLIDPIVKGEKIDKAYIAMLREQFKELPKTGILVFDGSDKTEQQVEGTDKIENGTHKFGE